MKTVSAMIVDDEQLVLDNLKYLLLQFSGIKVVHETTDPCQALDIIESDSDIDVVFMDVSMPKLNGIEAAKRIYSLNPAVKIVFLTAYEEYALSAFEANAVDYILKPVTLRRLSRSLKKINNLLANERLPAMEETDGDHQAGIGIRKFVGFKNNRYFVIDIPDGYYLKFEERHISLFTKDDVFLVKHNLNYWEEQLKGQNWIRCNRSFLINIDHIDAFTPMFNSTFALKMDAHAEEIPVSRTYVDQFKKILNL